MTVLRLLPPRPNGAGPQSSGSNPEQRTRLPLTSHHTRNTQLIWQMTLLLDVLLYVVAWAHVLLAPYSKVEESFTLHAIHDLLFYGGNPDALQKVRI
jgi:hypothetical protein